MPIPAPHVNPPIPTPSPDHTPPWSLTVAELGALLTEAQRKSILARLRVKGYAVQSWAYPPK